MVKGPGRASKVRLDKRVVDLGLAPSRERAQALILAGQVVVGDHTVDKPGHSVDEALPVRLKGEALPWVSRGGLKLVEALDRYQLDPSGRRAIDVGASTGGFTDVLLERGASTVCAVDVGHGQLAWKLQQDPRVVSIENLNARHLASSLLPFVPEVAVCDVSFISLELVLPRIAEVTPGAAWMVCLVKPQFEVGRAEVGKGGVVRDPEKRLGAVEKIRALAGTLGLVEIGWCESPITGPAGNVEYLLALRSPTS